MPKHRTLPLRGEMARTSPEAGIFQGDVRPALEMCHFPQANTQSQISDWLPCTVPALGRISLNTKELQGVELIRMRDSGKHVGMAHRQG